MTELNDFAGLTGECSDLSDAAVVMLPVCYDATSTWLKGSAKGPLAIIRAWANMELYDIETDSQVYKKGIFTAPPMMENPSPEIMVDAVEKPVCSYLEKNKFTVVIGGEHSVSIGSIKAHAKFFPALTVLQLDAHSDLRDTYDGSGYNHACVAARIREFAEIVQVGTRSMDICEKKSVDPDRVFYARDIYNNTGWTDSAVSLLSDKVYVTIDLDVFDPSIMPSTGTPEPGGLLWYDVLSLLKQLCRKKDLVGFDVVELCPNENNSSPDFLAAKLIYKLLSYKFNG